jgi:hypothetical protein
MFAPCDSVLAAAEHYYSAGMEKAMRRSDTRPVFSPLLLASAPMATMR